MTEKTIKQQIVESLQAKPWQSLAELKRNVGTSKTPNQYVKELLSAMVKGGQAVAHMEFDNVTRYAMKEAASPRPAGRPSLIQDRSKLSAPPKLPWIKYPSDPKVLRELINFFDAGHGYSEAATEFFTQQREYCIALKKIVDARHK